jgi:uncharacterized peroxidase-related enzyme
MTDPLLPLLTPDEATPEARAQLLAAKKAMGMLPNLYRVVGNSPASLTGYAGFSDALDHGQLPKRTREQIALMVAATNGCENCLATHRVTGRIAKLGTAEISEAEAGRAADPREAAALSLAAAMLAQIGNVDDATLAAARAAGWSDGDIVEVAAHVALNQFTNMINRLARTPIDFGRVARAAAEVMARFGKG